MQSFLFSIDSEYESLTRGITDTANVSHKAVPWLQGSPTNNLKLQICLDVPNANPSSCLNPPVFQSGRPISNSPSSSDGSRKIDIGVPFIFQADPGAIDRLDVSQIHLISKDGRQSILIQPVCSEAFLYIRELFNRAKREDLTFIALQFWLFSISFIAILKDSIPHTLTVLLTRTLATGWSGYAIWRTRHRRQITDELITNPGSACSIELLPAYFETRFKYEIPDLLLNCTALCIAAYLSTTLLKVYSQQSFKVMGAPKRIVRIQKFFMGVLAILQLEVFVVIVAMSLWIDELIHGPIAAAGVSEHTVVYKGAVITTAILLWPWLALGWYSIRHEHKKGLYVYLGFSFVMVFIWSMMYYSQIYRWTWIMWPLFGIYATASLILLVSSFVFGIICRINFGKGLKQYIRAERALSSSNFKPEVFTHDVEKSTIIADDDDIKLDLKKLPTPNPDLPTPTYYVPELRSDSPWSNTGSDRGGRQLPKLNLKRTSVFDMPRPVSPPLSMSPASDKRPLVTVTRLSRPAGAGVLNS